MHVQNLTGLCRCRGKHHAFPSAVGRATVVPIDTAVGKTLEYHGNVHGNVHGKTYGKAQCKTHSKSQGKSSGKSRGEPHGKTLDKSSGRSRCNTRGEIGAATLFLFGDLHLPRVIPRDSPRRVLPPSVLHVLPRAWHVRLAVGPAVVISGQWRGVPHI